MDKTYHEYILFNQMRLMAKLVGKIEPPEAAEGHCAVSVELGPTPTMLDACKRAEELCHEVRNRFTEDVMALPQHIMWHS